MRITMSKPKSKMTKSTKDKLAAYKSGKKKPMTKAARAAKARRNANKLERYKTGPKKGQFKPASQQK